MFLLAKPSMEIKKVEELFRAHEIDLCPTVFLQKSCGDAASWLCFTAKVTHNQAADRLPKHSRCWQEACHKQLSEWNTVQRFAN